MMYSNRIFLDKLFHDLTDEDESIFDQSPHDQDDIHLIYQSIEEKILKIENKLRQNDQNQYHLHLIERFKEKFYKKNQSLI